MFYDGGYMMGGMHGLWWLFWLVLIGVGVYFLTQMRGRGDGTGGGSAEDSAVEILQKRLARGEITPEQYEQHKALLERDHRDG